MFLHTHCSKRTIAFSVVAVVALSFYKRTFLDYSSVSPLSAVTILFIYLFVLPLLGAKDEPPQHQSSPHKSVFERVPRVTWTPIKHQ